MATPYNKTLTLSTSYNGSEQTPTRGTKVITFGLADEATIAFTIRITTANGTAMERAIPAGGEYFWPPIPMPLDEGWTWNAKSASGGPDLDVTEFV